MKAVFFNDLLTALKQKTTIFTLLAYLVLGFFVGYQLNISIGEEILANAPYSIGFMTGLLSLVLILIATLLAFSILFKEKDADFGLIVFSTPIKKKDFAFARFLSFYVLTLLSFLVLIYGYSIGLHFQTESDMNPGFNLWHFVYPFLIFGVINSFLVCSILFFVAQKFHNKLLVAITGLFLYILYMIVLMFSNAPFMAQSLPQSLFAQRVSALVDVFGLSGYFFEAKDLSVQQRNSSVVPFRNFLVLNRIFITLISFGMVHLGIQSFSFVPIYKRKNKKVKHLKTTENQSIPFMKAATSFTLKTKWQAAFSFMKMDVIYLFKSIPLVVISLLLLFYLGVEMFGDIDMGIRLPEQYASSGLLAQTINESFYFIGTLVVVYFANDIFWRSQSSGFSIIQNTTFYAKEKLLGHLGSITVLILFLSGLMLVEAIIFQFLFNFPHFDWQAYFGLVVFNTFPLFVLSILLLFVNFISKNKYVALGLSFLVFLLLVTPILKNVIPNPLFGVLSGYKGQYSDFIGYGAYLPKFLWRLLFGISLIGIFFFLYQIFFTRNKKIVTISGIGICLIFGFVGASNFLEGYEKKDKQTFISEKATYEKKYRKYQNIRQPTIKSVSTEIDLFPEKHSYRIKGNYWVKNLHNQPIDSLLLSVPNDFKINSLVFHYKNEIFNLKNSISELNLKQAMQPQDSAKLEFELEYRWNAVNGHDPFNAIIADGSFMRISRYFPQFGYDAENEIPDKNLREKYHLGIQTQMKKLEEEKNKIDVFISLNMQISTPKNQIAVGTGELKKYWQNEGRNYYQFAANAVPFRFAVSSAQYKVRRKQHKDILIEVLYYPLHENNVDHLIENTQLTLDYCTENFGPYPFKSVRFAEVSSFTQGFAGTAYPCVIFMTENMTFNANISVDYNQDVVNELAGHEVAHFWWGTNQIDPDYREGYAMLTESLAMYTEMMIYKKMYGKEKMMERLAIHQQIYDAEKGFSEDLSLLKSTKENAFVSYSKGAIVFVELSELIGEKKLNLALKNFLEKHKYPNAKPISTDLLEDILKVSDEKHQEKIQSLIQ
ncbi:M1 family aminopeptidase [Moheibacter lacus]|uniref:Aminopeptidase n=1 Tax=Moheibacter lacus TaxID=2745851 RepID=A0A838ZT43_9FLAO|nr:M1 family aminopeptidase [Moheibacter lacus]MBA5630150.1 aminopeptidase [Moheibacter lacus]